MEHHRYELPEDHGWKARPGSKVLVAGRGAVAFEFPQEWHVEVKEASVKISDRKPPDDDCVLEMSFRVLPGLEPEQVPMEDFLRAAVDGAREGSPCGPVTSERRHDLGLVWTEQRFEEEGRQARARTCLALGRGIQVLITFAFWEDDLARVTPAWSLALETLRVGRVIRDPLSGRAEDPGAN